MIINYIGQRAGQPEGGDALTFESVTQVRDWIIGVTDTVAIVTATYPGRIVQLTIGGPTKREGTVTEFCDGPTTNATYDRTTAIRAWLTRLGELS